MSDLPEYLTDKVLEDWCDRLKTGWRLIGKDNKDAWEVLFELYVEMKNATLAERVDTFSVRQPDGVISREATMLSPKFAEQLGSDDVYVFWATKRA